jgi:hypothetical protein
VTTERRPRIEKSHGKDEAAADTAEVAMERFNSLARKLVRVDRDELREQERRYSEDKEARQTDKTKTP